jgi:endonuclease YncB( thermonuclease family)
MIGLPAGAALADPCEGARPAAGAAFAGRVQYVGDGDSLCVGRSGDPATWIEVRLADFYAPELNGPGGRQAKAALEQIALGQLVQCRAGHRSYDRLVAQCTLGGATLGHLMRQSGMAEGGRGR